MLLQMQESGRPVSFIENYEIMYQDAEHTWVSEAKRERHVSYQSIP